MAKPTALEWIGLAPKWGEKKGEPWAKFDCNNQMLISALEK